MQYASEQYKEEMKLPLRGESFVYVYIGLINNDAQRSAKITSSFSGSEAHLYDDTATSTSVTSTENDGSITFTFEDFYELNIAGLTISFGASVPDSITVTNGTKTETFVTGGETDCRFDEGYTNCHYLKITPNSGKLSLKTIQFGIGLQFSNRQIMETSRNNSVNHISNDVPMKRFSFTVDNRLHLFNKDNPYGYADYFQEKQEVVYEYGRRLSDDSIYKIKGGKVLLQTWSSDDYKAQFTCVGYIDYMEEQYYKGQYYEDGISAYVLAQNVLADAGVENYRLDETLKSELICNPIPVCTHKEALQMIANACRCTLFEDRDGNICILSANRPSFVLDTTFTGATEYSTPSTLFEDNSANNYADAERNYAIADGSLLFLPENGAYRSVGFVSSQLANPSGAFTNNPSIDVSFKSEYHMKKLYLHFGVVIPTSLTISAYLNGSEVDSATMTNLTLSSVYEYDGVIDGLRIVFNGAEPNQRIHLNNIELNGYVDYELTYHDLKFTPVASSLEKVKDIKVHLYSCEYEHTEEGTSRSSYVRVNTTTNEDGGDTVDVTTGTSEYGSSVASVDAVVGDNTIILNSPYYDYKVSAGTIKESGAYYLVVTSDVAQTIIVYAKPFSKTDNIVTEKVHEKGADKESNNPLIGTQAMARAQLKWLKYYYDDDIEYDLTYRGDPILDADDCIYLENHFVTLNEIRIEEESIVTSAGMNFSCKLRGRRTWYQTDSIVAQAIVGRVRIDERIS